MRFQLPDGQTVGIDQPFMLNGVTYGTGWLRQMTPTQRAAFGAVEVPPPESFDERYYFSAGQPRPLADVKQRRLADLAGVRYGHEVGGISVGGVAVATDHVSQAKVNGALSLVTAQPATVIKWKTDAGFVSLDADDVHAIALAVGQHVQACFAREAEIAEEVDAAEDLAAVLAIDLAAGWPA